MEIWIPILESKSFPVSKGKMDAELVLTAIGE